MFCWVVFVWVGLFLELLVIVRGVSGIVLGPDRPPAAAAERLAEGGNIVSVWFVGLTIWCDTGL